MSAKVINSSFTNLFSKVELDWLGRLKLTVKATEGVKVYDENEIRTVETIGQGSSVVRSKTVSRVVIGGLILGPIGAALGAASSSKRRQNGTFRVCLSDEHYLTLQTNDQLGSVDNHLDAMSVAARFQQAA